MNDINWGIIGCGNVTELKSGPAFNKVEGSHLVAVMRRDATKAEDYAKRHHVGKWYDDAEALMNNEEINSVYIATPPASHLPYALEAIKKGLNVYVEKPVTRNAAEAQEMADAVRESKAKLTIAHYRRGLPMFLHIKKLLADKVIGEVRTVQIRMWQNRKAASAEEIASNWRVHPELSGGGYFHDLAPHQLDLMLFYFGEPAYYTGFSLNQAKTTQADDNVNGMILFKNNVVVNGSWAFNVAQSEMVDSCEIVGTEGKITFAFFKTYVTCKTAAGEETIDFVHPENIQHPHIKNVVAYFKGEGANPCSIDEAVVLMKVMDSFTTHI